MNTADYEASVPARRTPGSAAPHRRARRWWSVLIALLAGAYFAQAAIAGAMMSGVEGARQAHALAAALLIAASLAAGLVALITLRRLPSGARLGLTLLLLAVAAIVQAAVGAMSAKGANLTWVHVPLGVALVALAAQAATVARRLGAH